MGYLALVPTISSTFKERFNMNPMTALLSASILASSFAIATSHPFDTMKTVLQGDIGKFNKNVQNIKE